MTYMLPIEIVAAMEHPTDDLWPALQSRRDDYDTFPVDVHLLTLLPPTNTLVDMYRRWPDFRPAMSGPERLNAMVRLGCQAHELAGSVAMDVRVAHDDAAVSNAVRIAAIEVGPGSQRLVQRLLDAPEPTPQRVRAELSRLNNEGIVPEFVSRLDGL